jgi:hypothetical protein
MKKRKINRLTIVHDAHRYGVCPDCGAKFVGLDEVIHRKFHDHKCKEDASQALPGSCEKLPKASRNVIAEQRQRF